jgi:hypothetical protein
VQSRPADLCRTQACGYRETVRKTLARWSLRPTNEPDWYGAWRHDAIHQLFDKNDKLEAEFRLGTWARYDYDLDAARLIFSNQGKPVVAATVQVVGTTAANWLWAWGNESFPELVTRDANAAKRFGEEHGIAELTSAYLEDGPPEHLGWELSAVTALITSAKGVYRAPSGGGYLFLALRELSFVS